MLIKPRTGQKDFVRHTTRLYRENNETLFAYAKFIGEPTEYVLNQLLEDGTWDEIYDQFLGEVEGLPTAEEARKALPDEA